MTEEKHGPVLGVCFKIYVHLVIRCQLKELAVFYHTFLYTISFSVLAKLRHEIAFYLYLKKDVTKWRQNNHYFISLSDLDMVTFEKVSRDKD